MSNTPKDQDELPKEEIDRRRDAIAKRMLATPPQPRIASQKKARRRK